MKAAELKLHLLYYGIRIDIESMKLMNYKTDKHIHNDRHFVDSLFKDEVPQEIILIDENKTKLCVSVLARPHSPYKLCYDKTELYISFNDKRLDTKVEFVPEPLFWNLKTKDGIPNYNLLSLPGLSELSLWTWHDCALHYEKKGCSFCTTTRTATRFGTGLKSDLLTAYNIDKKIDKNEFFKEYYPILLNRSADALSSALELDFLNREYWFTFISGNLTDSLLDLQHEIVYHLTEDLLNLIPLLNREKIVINIMPPNDKKKIKELKDIGANYYMANLEIWDEEYFKSICPGKYIYGRQKFIEMLEYAVSNFGAGNVWCNFVCGIEPLEYQLEGSKNWLRWESFLAQTSFIKTQM